MPDEGTSAKRRMKLVENERADVRRRKPSDAQRGQPKKTRLGQRKGGKVLWNKGTRSDESNESDERPAGRSGYVDRLRC